MSRLRVRWWSLIKSAPLLFVVSASKHELEMRMGVRLVDGWPSPLSCDADVGRPLPGRYIISCDNLFYKRHELWTKKTWPFQKDIGLHKRLKLFKLNFLHGFPFSKTQRSAKCLTEQYMNSTWTYSSAVCESSPRWPCSIAGLAVVVFIAPPVCTVQYFLLTWCLQQNVQAMTVDGDWNMQKGGQNHNMPSSFQSLWIISEIKCFYLFQVNCKVSRMSVSFRWITRLIFFYSIYLSLGIRLNWVLCL